MVALSAGFAIKPSLDKCTWLVRDVLDIYMQEMTLDGTIQAIWKDFLAETDDQECSASGSRTSAAKRIAPENMAGLFLLVALSSLLALPLAHYELAKQRVARSGSFLLRPTADGGSHCDNPLPLGRGVEAGAAAPETVAFASIPGRGSPGGGGHDDGDGSDQALRTIAENLRQMHHDNNVRLCQALADLRALEWSQAGRASRVHSRQGIALVSARSNNDLVMLPAVGPPGALVPGAGVNMGLVGRA